MINATVRVVAELLLFGFAIYSIYLVFGIIGIKDRLSKLEKRVSELDW